LFGALRPKEVKKIKRKKKKATANEDEHEFVEFSGQRIVFVLGKETVLLFFSIYGTGGNQVTFVGVSLTRGCTCCGGRVSSKIILFCFQVAQVLVKELNAVVLWRGLATLTYQQVIYYEPRLRVAVKWDKNLLKLWKKAISFLR